MSPYIAPMRRRGEVAPRPEHAANGPGELNFQISRLFHLYLSHHGLSYRTINDICGAAGLATREFERRVVAPYEDIKIRENGDVYTGRETHGGQDV